MNKPIYKLVPRFPGILVPVYSEDEYKRVVASEKRMALWITAFCSLCVAVGVVVLVMAFFELTVE